MDFTLAGNPFAELMVTRIGGQRGVGSHRLLINIKLTPQPRAQGDEVLLLEMGGSLAIENTQGGPIGRLEQMDGPTPTKILGNAWAWTQVFMIGLDRRQLEKIKEIRQGKGLRFTIVLWGLAVYRNEVHRLTAQESYSVNQGTWVETLQELGYARTLLLEIPIPDEDTAPELTQAVNYMTSAQQAMNQGKSREAVGCCRDALEALSDALGDKDDQDTAAQELFKNTRALDKAGRLRVLRRALKVFVHPARHGDEDSARIEYCRSDSVAIISMIAALITQRGAEKV